MFTNLDPIHKTNKPTTVPLFFKNQTLNLWGFYAF